MTNPLSHLGTLAAGAVLAAAALQAWQSGDAARERAKYQDAVHLHLQNNVINLPIETSNPRVLRAVGKLSSFLPIPGYRRKGVRTRTVEGMRVHEPVGGPRHDAALLWFHGGGHALGKPSQDDRLLTLLAHELGITVIAPSYTLGAFPAGLDDAWSALRKVRPQYSRLAVGGASAGGGLAASLVQRAIDEDVAIDYQLLVYPMLDDRTVVRVPEPEGAVGRFVWTPGLNEAAWGLYLEGVGKPGAESLPEYAAPARREDLVGSPPTFIGVGSLDLFFAEDREYARGLIEAGVHVDWFQPTGAYHGFDMVVGPQMTLFYSTIAEKLQAGLGLVHDG